VFLSQNYTDKIAPVTNQAIVIAIELMNSLEKMPEEPSRSLRLLINPERERANQNEAATGNNTHR
jgi:hypothetical protein